MSWEISTFMQTVYHRFCQVKPNLSPSRYPLAISGYHGDFVEILVTRHSVNIIMAVVLVQLWVWSWNCRCCMVVNQLNVH